MWIYSRRPALEATIADYIPHQITMTASDLRHNISSRIPNQTQSTLILAPFTAGRVLHA